MTPPIEDKRLRGEEMRLRKQKEGGATRDKGTCINKERRGKKVLPVMEESQKEGKKKMDKNSLRITLRF